MESTAYQKNEMHTIFNKNCLTTTLLNFQRIDRVRSVTTNAHLNVCDAIEGPEYIDPTRPINIKFLK